ncbi:hypothetical protein [Natrononativus amylolyticus]|uniref:hypothetical protein n=1 Tax=Natrononativus amylolyticus TaxID=2963434 RepID=UPI0020CF4C13|nr:hypothetical protein [Natrononativus amylolyticus]
MGTGASEAVGTRVALRDVLVHATVPAALILVYVAPIPYESFLYQPGRSGVADAYWSAVGHADLEHLLTNLFGYAVLVTVSFALLGRRRRLYYALFLGTLLASPPLTAGLLEAYFRLTALSPSQSAGGAGFSIVTAALLALLSGAIALHDRRTLERPVPAGLTGLGLFSIAATAPAARIDGAGIAWLVLGSVGAAYLAGRAWTLFAQRQPTAAVAVALQVSALVIFVGVAVDLFLLEARAWAGHFLGFVSGFLVVWIGISALALRSPGRGRS